METALTSRFETGIVEKWGFKAKCQRCEYRWIYCGGRNFACCPVCHTSVVIRPQRRLRTVTRNIRVQNVCLGSKNQDSSQQHIRLEPEADYATCEVGEPDGCR